MDKDAVFNMPRLIVAAANKNMITGEIIIGIRHHCPLMNNVIRMRRELGIPWKNSECEQGFVDQKGVFLTREEAWVLASENGQRRRCTAKFGTLHSEDLW